MLMCFPALAASISRESTRSGVDAGIVSLTDATGTGADPGADPGACRHKVELAVVELGGCMAGIDAGAVVDSDGPGHRG